MSNYTQPTAITVLNEKIKELEQRILGNHPKSLVVQLIELEKRVRKLEEAKGR